MSKKTSTTDWAALFKISCTILAREKIPDSDWSFGGGSALMTYYNHRASKDIDIFLRDVQLLTRITPRLNDFVSEKTDDYTEMSNYLKLKVGKQEIDFIVAPLLTKHPTTKKIVAGYKLPVQVETPEEIIIKKIFYRADSFKVRDIFDMAVVIKNKENALLENMDIISNKIIPLKERILKLHKVYDTEISALEIIDQETAEHALAITSKFINKCLNLRAK